MRYWPQKPPLGVPINWGDPLARGLVGCWLMNEGSGNKVYDLTGNQSKYLGNFAGDTTWKAGKSGNSLYFDGTGDYVKLQFWDGGPKVTLHARVNFTEAIGANDTVTAAYSDTDSLTTFILRREGTGKVQFVVVVGGVAKIAASSKTITSGVWWDITAVNDGTQGRIYINGQLDGTPATTGNMDVDAAAWAIGIAVRTLDWTSIVNPMQGNIEFLMRYDRALSATQVRQLYMSPFRMFAESF